MNLIKNQNILIRTNYTLIALLSFTAWGMIAYKAFNIPITHDELATIIHYFNFKPWEIMMYPDPWPNNHILNTLAAKLSMTIFGREQWAARLPNILSFGIYLYASFHICKKLFSEQNFLIVVGFTAFVYNPFLLDFFSLCRGYGMSNALLLLSSMYLLEGFTEQKERYVWRGLTISIFASYANFTLLLFWCAVTILTAFFFLNNFIKDRSLKSLLLKYLLLGATNIAYLALIITPIHKMNSTNQFSYWESNGFYKDTLLSLVTCSIYGARFKGIPHQYFALSIVFFFIISGCYTLYLWKRKSWFEMIKSPVFISFSLLGLTVLSNIVQTLILKTPNLTTRTALSYYPLIVFLGMSVLHRVYQVKPKIALGFGVLLFVVNLWHIKNTVNLTSVREWWYDESTFQVINTLKQFYDGKNPVTLRTGWVFHPSFTYYTQLGDAQWIELGAYNKEIDTIEKPQFYYIMNEDYSKLEGNYEKISSFGWDRVLLKRKN